MGVGEMGIGEMGIGEMGIGKMTLAQNESLGIVVTTYRYCRTQTILQ